MNGSYTKLRSGDWGVRVQGTPGIGATITVRTKADSLRYYTRRVTWEYGALTTIYDPIVGRWAGALTVRDTPSGRGAS